VITNVFVRFFCLRPSERRDKHRKEQKKRAAKTNLLPARPALPGVLAGQRALLPASIIINEFYDLSVQLIWSGFIPVFKTPVDRKVVFVSFACLPKKNQIKRKPKRTCCLQGQRCPAFSRANAHCFLLRELSLYFEITAGSWIQIFGY